MRYVIIFPVAWQVWNANTLSMCLPPHDYPGDMLVVQQTSSYRVYWMGYGYIFHHGTQTQLCLRVLGRNGHLAIIWWETLPIHPWTSRFVATSNNSVWGLALNHLWQTGGHRLNEVSSHSPLKTWHDMYRTTDDTIWYYRWHCYRWHLGWNGLEVHRRLQNRHINVRQH